MKKSSRDHPERRRGISQNKHRSAASVLTREILHFVQDDRTYGGVMHGGAQMEREKVTELEWWSGGVMECWFLARVHYSITPLLHYSNK
jgi:hypothetical protein